MELYTPKLYTIRALSNLHPGSGSTNAGKIDNLIQRDAADDLPCINDTSLKGAIKEYFEHLVKNNLYNESNFNTLFGKGDNENSNAGTFIFQQASLLSLPVRSSKMPYYNAASFKILQEWLEKLTLFSLKDLPLYTELEKFIQQVKPQLQKGKGLIFGTLSNDEIIYFEDFKFTAKVLNSSLLTKQIKELLGNDPVIFNEDDFNTLANNDHLPVIPRNKLENGESKNLFYEQVLPRETRLAFIVLVPKKIFAVGAVIDGETLYKSFEEKLAGEVIQIGANASVGYGWCLMENKND